MFHDLLKLVPWSVFDTLVKKHGSDQQLRGFDTRHQFIALLHGQFSGAESLRAIETAMTSHEARLYRVGGKAPRRSTFADANRYRGPRVFSGLFEHMPGMANRKMPQEMKEVVRLIDSTSLHLAGVGAQWARFSEDVCGAKAHVIYDPDLGRPVYHSVTAANVNDITAAKETPIDAGASKYPPAKPGALRCEPLKAAGWGALTRPLLQEPPIGGGGQRNSFIGSIRVSSFSWF